MSSQLERGAEERVKFNPCDAKTETSGSCSPVFIMVAILLSTTIIGLMSFCFVWHHSIKAQCSAEAILGETRDEWMWNLSKCPWQIDPFNKTAVKINSDGIYFIDFQVQAKNISVLTDLTLKISPSQKKYVSGAFQSPNANYCFVRMSHILELRKGDALNFTVYGYKDDYFNDSKFTYWKIVKLTGL